MYSVSKCNILVIRKRHVLRMTLLRKFRPPYALGTNVPRDMNGYAGKSYLKLRYQLHGKSVPNGLQVRPILGPLGLFVCGNNVHFLYFIQFCNQLVVY